MQLQHMGQRLPLTTATTTHQLHLLPCCYMRPSSDGSLAPAPMFFCQSSPYNVTATTQKITRIIIISQSKKWPLFATPLSPNGHPLQQQNHAKASYQLLSIFSYLMPLSRQNNNLQNLFFEILLGNISVEFGSGGVHLHYLKKS